MSATREEMLIEADRRGLLTGERKAAFDEAVRRGMISSLVDQAFEQTGLQRFDGSGRTRPVHAQQPALPAPAPEPAMPEQTPPDTSFGASVQQGVRRAAGSFVANMIGLPHAAGELLALGAALPQTAAKVGAAAVRGEPLNVGERFSEARQEQEQSFPASALRALPNPSGTDVLEVGRTLGELPGAVARGVMTDASVAGEVRAAADRSAATEQQLEEQHPIASLAGDISADAATLLTLRPNFKALLRMRTGKASVEPKIAEEVETATAKIQRALGRTAEAGFEGAVIGALGDGDPAVTAAWSAGIQAGGSIGLELKREFWKRPLGTFGALYLAHEVYRAVAPGSQDFFASKDEAVQALVGAYAVGVVASLAGAGRGKDLKSFADAFSTVSRGSIASFITNMQAAEERAAVGQEHYSAVLGKLAEDPNYFGREARHRIELASNREGETAVLDEIDELMKRRTFRSRLADLESDE